MGFLAILMLLVDARERRIGDANNPVMQQAIDSLALFPFTQLLGMDIESYSTLIARARSEAKNPVLKAYFPLYARSTLSYLDLKSLICRRYICIGKKPS